MQAQMDPQARPALSSSARTWAALMCDGSSMGISTVWKPHFLNWAKSFVLSSVNGEAKRKELMPNLMDLRLLFQTAGKRADGRWTPIA